jgi:beta-lactamase regulating signal transducer with metallopeptidase domain
MIDLQFKFAVAVAFAWVATRRVSPANAASAHRVWLLVLASPVLWMVGETLVPPIAFARLRPGVLPQGIISAGSVALIAAAGVYVVIAALLLLRLACGIGSVRRLIQRSRPLGPADLARLPDWASSRSHVRESDLDSPVTAGALNAVVLLPAGWRSLSPAALESILRHEAAHVRRGDCAIALACGLMEALFWFNPAVWIACARVRWFAEMACDHEAATGMNRHEYASQLLTLAAAWGSARRPVNVLTAGAETHVSRRIHLLLDEAEGGTRRSILIPIVAALLVLGVPLAATVRVDLLSSSERAASADTIDHARTHQMRHRH